MVNLLDNAPNHTPEFRTKIWFEINDNSRGKYNTIAKLNVKIQC